MSLSVFQRTDENLRRDSYEDRVCDDLSQVLLQFLPFRYKFKFECVSKQFQRTVFQRQEHLNLEEVLPRSDQIWPTRITLNPNPRLEAFVRKLPNLKSIGFNRCYSPKLEDKNIELIIKYCHKLWQNMAKRLSQFMPSNENIDTMSRTKIQLITLEMTWSGFASLSPELNT